jgi:hypothetical protein
MAAFEEFVHVEHSSAPSFEQLAGKLCCVNAVRTRAISIADLPLVDKPSLPSRTSRILDRYVFRDKRDPGESWKRRIEARRERRA